MKKIIVFILLLSNFTFAYTRDYFMYVNGEKRFFEISPNEMLVQFVENTETSAAKSIIEKNMSFKVSDVSKTDNKEWHLIRFSDTDKTHGQNKNNRVYTR